MWVAAYLFHSNPSQEFELGFVPWVNQNEVKDAGCVPTCIPFHCMRLRVCVWCGSNQNQVIAAGFVGFMDGRFMELLLKDSSIYQQYYFRDFVTGVLTSFHFVLSFLVITFFLFIYEELKIGLVSNSMFILTTITLRSTTFPKYMSHGLRINLRDLNLESHNILA